MSEEFQVPTDPNEITKIRQAVKEASAMLQMIDDRREQYKDTATYVNEEFGLPKKQFNKLVRTHHKQNYGEVSKEADTFQVLYEVIVEPNQDNV